MHDGVGGRATSPAHRLAGADDRAGGHGRAAVGTSFHEPVVERTEEGVVRLGAHTTAKAPAPEPARAEDGNATGRVPPDQGDPGVLWRPPAVRDEPLPARARQGRRYVERREAVEGER